MTSLEWVMLIDDDEVDRFINERIIRQCNYEQSIITFDDPNQALEWFKENKENILSNTKRGTVLLDINMPEMNGFEFMQLFNEQFLDLKPLVNIVTLSSSIQKTDRQKMFDFGVDAYYVKPLNHDDLNQIMHMEFK
jgi:CheY-like chemotaxis protein